VRRLAERLRAAGLRVWFDEWSIAPGEDIYLAIERGLETARTLVLFLSPAALGSDWIHLERGTALFRDPVNAERRFLTVLLETVTFPTRSGATAPRRAEQRTARRHPRVSSMHPARAVLNKREATSRRSTAPLPRSTAPSTRDIGPTSRDIASSSREL
jgi:hypothetical protein